MRDHRSLLAWQRAATVTRAVLGLARSRWQPWTSAVFSQLQRSALSVQLNIAEGHALRSPGRFRYHLTVAYGSAVETIELLELCLDAGIVPRGEGQPILETAVESRALLLGLIHRKPLLGTQAMPASSP